MAYYCVAWYIQENSIQRMGMSAEAPQELYKWIV